MDEVDLVAVEGVDLVVVDEVVVVDEKVDLELGNLLSEPGIVHSERAAVVDAVVSEEVIEKVEVGLKGGNEVDSQVEAEVIVEIEDQEVASAAVDEEVVDSVVEVEEVIGEDSVDVEVTEVVETDTSRLHHSQSHSHRDRTLPSSCLGTEQEDQQDKQYPSHHIHTIPPPLLYIGN